MRDHQEISSSQGGLTALNDQDEFGSSIAALGDLDGDGVVDIAVGAPREDEGAPGTQTDLGAVYILFLHANGTVRTQQKIGKERGTFTPDGTEGGLTPSPQHQDRFGSSLAAVGDIDGDGVTDLAVGAPFDDGVFADRGAVYILFLNTNGAFRWGDEQKISSTSGKAGGISGTGTGVDLPTGSDIYFGCSIALIGDLDGNGVRDVAGAWRLCALSSSPLISRVYLSYLICISISHIHLTMPGSGRLWRQRRRHKAWRRVHPVPQRRRPVYCGAED